MNKPCLGYCLACVGLYGGPIDIVYRLYHARRLKADYAAFLERHVR